MKALASNVCSVVVKAVVSKAELVSTTTGSLGVYAVVSTVCSVVVNAFISNDGVVSTTGSL